MEHAGSAMRKRAMLASLVALTASIALALVGSADAPPATYTDLSYGPDIRNVLDLWLAHSTEPTPLLLLVHWGGFSSGSKEQYAGFRGDTICQMLDAGISVASINHRYTDGGAHPYPAPMMDGARAVQFLRYKATDYNLDKNRFAGMGGSSGGILVMWLGFHDDLADADSEDPVLRESSRLQVLTPEDGATCLHPPTLEDWFNVPSLVEHPAFASLFGVPEGKTLPKTAAVDAAMREASPICHLTADDPPIYLFYRRGLETVDENTDPNVWAHHPIMGIKLKEQMDALGIECNLEYTGMTVFPPYGSLETFIIHIMNTLAETDNPAA